MLNTQQKQESAALRHILNVAKEKAKSLFDRSDDPVMVVSPYRMNPLGAHIDHQGGSVLARTIDQYTVLALYPTDTSRVILHCDNAPLTDAATAFDFGMPVSGDNWERYAKASANCFAAGRSNPKGFTGVVCGTLVSAGLSSSASVILAYLLGLAHANQVQLEETELVELSRQVENEHMGLNNGLQDQMSIVFGRNSALSLLDMKSVSAEYIDNPANIEDVCWVVCYSGYSRELVSSGFNDRVRECREAANLLDNSATHLGEVATERRDEKHLSELPTHLGLRARHVYTEMQRVEKGCAAWRLGDWAQFGELMNQSCHSSINQYQCGSEPMIALHELALKNPAVYGSRFGGGGYGGCLMMLTRSLQAKTVQRDILSRYMERFPEKKGVARAFIAHTESSVRRVHV